ncbi:MAG: polysaccharide deacetylase family protein [Acidobacteria bacterium]|nr:polysaccharide deacetylase family protein [Acidobacteriota bacterium]
MGTHPYRAILMYHSLDDSGSVISLHPEMFRLQMRILFDRGIPAVTPQRLLAGDGLEPGHPAVSLTFDDGFANFYTQAFPALADYNSRATVFLTAGCCGGVSEWSGQPSSFQSREILCWSRVQELHRLGIQFGAHTMTHPPLTAIPLDRARAEILESKKRIEDRIGEAVTTFAYPYGIESQALREIVAESFDLACSTRMGYVSDRSQRESLERIDVYYLRNPEWFRRLFRRSGSAYLLGRRALRRCRHAVLGPY